MDHFKLAPRRSLYRWSGWFFLINAFIGFLVIFGYLPQFSFLKEVPGATSGSTVFAYGYFIFAFFAQVSLYMFVCALVCVLLVTLFPWRVLIILVGALLSAMILLALVGDAVAFRLYHMHYAVVGWRVFQAGAFSEVIPLGLKEEATVLAAIAFAALLEIVLALWLWRIFSKPRHKTAIKVMGTFVVVVWLLVYTSFGLAVKGVGWQGGISICGFAYGPHCSLSESTLSCFI